MALPLIFEVTLNHQRVKSSSQSYSQTVRFIRRLWLELRTCISNKSPTHADMCGDQSLSRKDWATSCYENTSLTVLRLPVCLSFLLGTKLAEKKNLFVYQYVSSSQGLGLLVFNKCLLM